MKYCLRCGKELPPRKRKYCNSHCQYWYLAKKNETFKKYSVSQHLRMARAEKKQRQGRLGVRYN
jgi:hypothetical protein